MAWFRLEAGSSSASTMTIHRTARSSATFAVSGLSSTALAQARVVWRRSSGWTGHEPIGPCRQDPRQTRVHEGGEVSDRTSVGKGKRGSVRVNQGGRRSIKKKKKENKK